MDPIEPNQIVQTQTQPSQTAESTFSAEVAKEDVLGNAAFESNSQVVSAHRKSTLFRFLWIALALLLLSLLGFVLYRSIKTSSTAKPTSSASNYNDTRINLAGFTSGSGATTGQLAVNGSANIVSDLNVGGNANVGGTLTATNLQGDGTGIINLQASNITGVISTGQLNPFIAYTNKDNQAFFGNSQVFRNATNGVGAFEIQNSSADPALSINTLNNFVGIGTSAPNYELDVVGNGQFSGQLLVGPNASIDGTILLAGGLFGGRSISRTLTTQQIVSSNAVNRGIYAGLANELLIEPSIDPAANDNYFVGSYSALQTNGTYDYDLNGGALASYTHNGTGTVDVGVGSISLVSNLGTGTINRAVGNLAMPAINGGTMNSYVGFSAFNPQLFALPQLGFPSIINGGTISKYFGVQVLDTSSASPINQILNPLNNIGTQVNANISSEGTHSQNFFEGKINIGICSGSETSLLLCGTFLEPPTSGNKLIVNSPSVTDVNATIQVTSRAATDKPLVVQGIAGQTGDLTQWQDSTGAVKSEIAANGSLGLGTTTPGAFRLNTTDTSTTNVAQFNGSAGTQCTVVTGTGWSCSSDESLKTNILSVNNGLDVISQLRGVTYNWKSDPTGAQQDGFIAQEVQKILPQLVTTDKSTGLLSLNKDGILPYLVNAIQDQQKQIDTLKGGSSTVASIDVLQQLADAKAVTFGGDVTINGNVVIKGTITGGADSRGKVTVATGATQATHSFASAYASQPYVQVTPLEQIDGAYWVSGNSTTGFTVQLEKPQATPVSFNWFVLN